MANVKGIRVKTGEVRFSYPHLFEKYRFSEKDDPKYMLTLIIDKQDTKTLGALEQAYKDAVVEGQDVFGKSFSVKGCPFIRAKGSAWGLLVDCDEDESKAEDPNYKGKYLLPLKSSQAPGVLAKETGKTELTKEEGEKIVYAGCYGLVSLRVFAYSNARMGVSANLNNVLKTRDGEKFSGRKTAGDDFAAELEAMSDDELASLI